MAIPKVQPTSFTVRPINRGLNQEKPPQEIDVRESPSLSDVRFSRGLVQFRTGFNLKYKGNTEHLLWLDLVYSATESQVIGFGSRGIYALNGDAFEQMPIYDASGVLLTYPVLNMDPMVQYLGVDAGFGQYQFAGANGGALFPGSGNYETLTVLCNGSTDGVFAIAYTAGGAEAEAMGGGICPSLGRSIAIWDGRIFVGGDENDNAKITWSSKGLLSDWTIASGAGSTIIGDNPDWIQSMRKLGEYLIVYKERSIFIGSQTYLVDPPVRFDPAPGQGIGLAAPNSIGDLGEEHIFLGWDNIYIFSLQRIEAIGTQIKDEVFYGSDGILPKYLGNCTGIIAEEFDEYWLFVPTGKIPTAYAEGEETGIENLHPDPLCADHASWGAITCTLTSVAGNIGAEAIKVAPDVDSIGIAYHTVTGASIATYSLVVWLKADSATDINMSIVDTSMTTIFDTRTVSVSTSFEMYVLECDITAAMDIRVVIQSASADNVDFTIDAVQLIVLDSIEDKYLLQVDGHRTVGYIGNTGEPEKIPLIADKIGQWIPDTVWVYNYSTNAWSKWRIPMTGFGYDSILTITTIGDLTGTIEEQNWRFDEKRITEFAPTNLIAQIDGQVYEIATGYTNDFGGVFDKPFLAYWQSKDFDLGRPDVEKTASKVTIYHETSHAPITITIGYSMDSGLSWEEQDVQIATGRYETYITLFATGPQIRFRFKATSPGFYIHGFSVKIIPRGETNVY